MPAYVTRSAPAGFSAGARARLVGALNLLTSDKSGEVQAAAAAAVRVARKFGGFEAVIVAPVMPAAEPERTPVRWREQVETLLQDGRYLSAWETNFLTSLRTFRRLSPRQGAVLARLWERRAA
jgi:hypothetical protein